VITPVREPSSASILGSRFSACWVLPNFFIDEESPFMQYHDAGPFENVGIKMMPKS